MSLLSGQIKALKQESEFLSDEYQSILMQVSLVQAQSHKLRGKVKGLRREVAELERREKEGLY